MAPKKKSSVPMLLNRERAFAVMDKYKLDGLLAATPVNIYFTALFLKVLPLTEVTTRLPSVIIGLLNIALLFGIARRLFANGRTVTPRSGTTFRAALRFGRDKKSLCAQYLMCRAAL